MRPLRLLFAVAALACTALFSGCVAFIQGSPHAAQQDTIGNVRIWSAVCATMTGQNGDVLWPGCEDSDVSGGDADGNSGYDAAAGNYQLLTGYRIPDGSVAPDSFTIVGGGLTFTRSASYTGELERLAPTPSGFQWVGYLSGPFTHTESPNGQAHALGLSPEFTLPTAPDGEPFAGPFRYRQVLGARQISGASPPDRPVVCGDTVSAQADYGYCIDAPGVIPLNLNLVAPTRDLGILGGGEQPAVQAGSSLSVPFTAKYVGAATSANFTLEATTSAPGASATPSQPGLAPPTNSTTPLSVNVAVPAGTPVGLYDVTLSARLPNGQVRTGKRQIQVTAAANGGAGGAGGVPGTGAPGSQDSVAPRVAAKLLRGQTISSLLRRGLRVRVTLGEPGKVSGALLTRRPRASGSLLVARRAATFAGPGSRTVVLRLARKPRRQLVRTLGARRSLRLTLRLKSSDTAGNATTQRLPIRLRR